METQNLTRLSGATLAILAAGLASHAGSSLAKAKPGSTAVNLVHCAGINSCKGHNDCKTASNDCKGLGSCKGQGFVAAPEAACEAAGGNVIDPGVQVAVQASSFVHCYGVNSCKGHNDCKTAANACKGQGECKGQGFIALPTGTCSNIGGTTG